MNSNNLLSNDSDMTDCPFPFFNEPQTSLNGYYKIYNDGGHFVATRCFRRQAKHKPKDITLQPKQLTDGQKEIIYNRALRKARKTINSNKERKLSLKLVSYKVNHSRTDIDILFDSLYYQAFKNGLRDNKKTKPMSDYIKAGILKLFPDYPDLDCYIDKKIKSKLNNLLHRKKRFRRKADLNQWNYFVTFTYDDKKQTAETFRKKLRRCLSNLHTRRGWRYMGVFECAPDTGRLHFHGLLYIPDGEMIGTITEKRDYSTAQHKMQVTHINDFFNNTFGRNDFTELNKMALKYGHTLDYILKYIGKTNEKIVYSRGIPTEICKELTDNDIITEFTDFVTKYVLFDNVIDWEKDILHNTVRKQMTIIDLLCNPPQVA